MSKRNLDWRITGLICYLALTVSVISSANANTIEPDHSSIPEWLVIKDLMFGDREIKDGSKDVLALYLNTKLDDSSTVPIMVNALMDQTDEMFIKTLYLVIDRNPIPTAGVFQFNPQAGKVKLETRLRFEKFSFIRAIAETNSGELYMDQRWVQVAGGCSAPSGKNANDPQIGKMRFRLDDHIRLKEPNLVQFQIKHPNESTLAADLEPGYDARFINKVSVQYNGKSIMSGDINFSLSDNPIFKFYFAPQGGGVLSVRAEDTHDSVFTHSVDIEGGE
ncbi:quinoprotein dehydrogenase-associated SoxYZ-like carrier [Burkholderiales bacterium]|nr:quinoprotein dehydrogenase-associated SoxYZ-like carrier [Betaproteobacteria bacterium]MDC1433723.1 quinoprotein dehydrogenase-associated SoxYZ-like carrier [Burkholderiales bacterium]